jgi:hypothetical protein
MSAVGGLTAIIIPTTTIPVVVIASTTNRILLEETPNIGMKILQLRIILKGFESY